MKPGVNPKLVAWIFAAIGGVLVQLSKADSWTMQGILDALLTTPDWHAGLAALGGGVVGTLKLGPGQIRLTDLPEEVRASMVPAPANAPNEPAAGRDPENH